MRVIRASTIIASGSDATRQSAPTMRLTTHRVVRAVEVSVSLCRALRAADGRRLRKDRAYVGGLLRGAEETAEHRSLVILRETAGAGRCEVRRRRRKHGGPATAPTTRGLDSPNFVKLVLSSDSYDIVTATICAL